MPDSTHQWTSILAADMDAAFDPLAPRVAHTAEEFSRLFGEPVQRDGDVFATDDELELLEQLRGARRRLFQALAGGAGLVDAADDL